MTPTYAFQSSRLTIDNQLVATVTKDQIKAFVAEHGVALVRWSIRNRKVMLRVGKAQRFVVVPMSRREMQRGEVAW